MVHGYTSAFIEIIRGSNTSNKLNNKLIFAKFDSYSVISNAVYINLTNLSIYFISFAFHRDY